MKAWAEHAADIYLLANDIRKNHDLQEHGYKGRFYYTFNPNIRYLQADSDAESQLKLLEQLVDKKAVRFEEKVPSAKTLDVLLSRNTKRYAEKTILLTIRPKGFNEVLKKYKRYGQPVVTKQKKMSGAARLEGTSLIVAGYTIPFQEGNQKYMLQVMLENRQSRKQEWVHSELEHYLEPPDDLKYPEEFVRNTANNINKRVAKATGSGIPRLLRITVKTVQLDQHFV